MNVDTAGFEFRWRLPKPIRWLDYLHAYWEEARADDLMPSGDELFLGDLTVPLAGLVLAYHDTDGDAFRVEFAGPSACAELAYLAGLQLGCVTLSQESSRPAKSPVGTRPERAEPGSPFAWLGAGNATTRRMMAPAAVHMRHGKVTALHLPYDNGSGQVGVILSALARWPDPYGDLKDPSGKVVPFRPVQPRNGRR